MRAQNAPDIVFLTSDLAYMAYGDFGPHWYERPRDRVADHDMDGIVIVKGEHVRPGTKMDLDAADVTPTLLYLYDLPIPTYMDGQVALKAFDEGWLARHPPRSTEDVRFSAKTEYVYDRDEQQEIEQRLSDLGYL
jgi:hypothetical protein